MAITLINYLLYRTETVVKCRIFVISLNLLVLTRPNLAGLGATFSPFMFSHCWLVQFALKWTWQVQENSIMFILIYPERKSFILLLSNLSHKSSIGIMYCVRIA